MAYWGISRSYNRPVLYIKKASNIYTTRAFIKSVVVQLFSFLFFSRWMRYRLLTWRRLLMLSQIRMEYSELTELEAIAEGGFGVIHRAKHQRWGTVVYKELKSSIIKDRSKFVHYCCSFHSCADAFAVFRQCCCQLPKFSKTAKCYKKWMFIRLMQIVFKCPTQLDGKSTQMCCIVYKHLLIVSFSHYVSPFHVCV